MVGGGVLSFNVLVVPEDPLNNGYILRPLVTRMLAECGKGNAKVEVRTLGRKGMSMPKRCCGARFWNDTAT
jgi:hypothetical protein